MNTYDLIGIGFGPSNIALAITLDEQTHSRQALNKLFIEKQSGFAWHKDMLLDNASMQISFLKDLATLRDPRSRFTFINYLYEKGRLQDFINLKTFYPSRHEFNDYLAWAASQFDDCCAYGEEVLEILPEKQGNEVRLLRVRTQDGSGKQRERLARNLAVGIGGRPHIPDCFKPFRDDARIIHSGQYLSAIARHGQARRVAVIGAGQSAAEIFLNMHGKPGAPQVDLIIRNHSLHPSDSSPYVNEIFNNEFTDYIYSRSPEERAVLLKSFRHTNYAAPDIEQIEEIFRILYNQKVTGTEHHRLWRRHEVSHVHPNLDGVHLKLQNLDTGEIQSRRYDTIVLATGYTRSGHKTLLNGIGDYVTGFDVERNYRLCSKPNFHPGVFLQGACETSHGLSDTLLSVTAVRTQEICAALLAPATEDFTAIDKKAFRPLPLAKQAAPSDLAS